MAFTRPTLAELITRIEADFVSRLDLAGAPLRKAMVRILARVIAGAVHGLYGLLVFLADQLFPDRSAADSLLRQAALYGIYPTPAAFASGDVAVSGIPGVTIPVDTVFRRADGAEFRVTSSRTTALDGTASVPVQAVLAGADGNTDVGVLLQFESPISGLDVNAYAGEDSIGGGADVGSVESVRARLLERLRDPPQGGSDADYKQWTLEVPGVTRAWVDRLGLGAGTVVVRFARDDDSSPIPSSGEIADVATYLETKRPATAAVTVLAPVEESRDYEMSITPDTAETRAAVVAELRDMFRTRVDLGGELFLSYSQGAISRALEPYNGTFTLITPNDNLEVDSYVLQTLGDITWD